MDSYELELLGIKRKLPLIPIDDDRAYASFVILGDVELIREAGKALAGKIEGVDYILTAEAKGIPLSFEMSREMGLKEYIILRKSVKTYMQDPMCEGTPHRLSVKKAGVAAAKSLPSQGSSH